MVAPWPRRVESGVRNAEVAGNLNRGSDDQRRGQGARRRPRIDRGGPAGHRPTGCDRDDACVEGVRPRAKRCAPVIAGQRIRTDVADDMPGEGSKVKLAVASAGERVVPSPRHWRQLPQRCWYRLDEHAPSNGLRPADARLLALA